MAADPNEGLISIASLPSPLDSAAGNVYAAPVYGFGASRKRKRHEVAVGIDGEGLNIYDIQSQTLLSSHALPPQSYLACPPTSIFCKHPISRISQRRTYLVLRNDPQDKDQRLICYTEETKRPNGLDDELSEPVKSQSVLDGGEIISVDTALIRQKKDEKPSFDLIISYRNGNVACITSDLSRVVWKHEQKPDARVSVDYTAIFDVESARKGLLQNREDVLAALQTGLAGSLASETQLLLRITRTAAKINLELYAIQGTSADQIKTRRQNLQLVLNYELPQKRSLQAEAQYYIHAASGLLYRNVDGYLEIYDLTGTIPRLQMEFGSRSEPVTGFARISSYAVQVFTGHKSIVFQTKYHAELETTELETYASYLSRRKSTSIDNVHFRPLTYLSNLATTVVLTPNNLNVLPTRNYNKPQLLDALGQGHVETNMEPYRLTGKSRHIAKEWEEWKNQVDAAVQSDNIAELENMATEALQLNPERLGSGAFNGSAFFMDFDPSYFDLDQIDNRKAIYLLSYALRSANDEEVTKGDRLIVATKSEALIKMLALTGYLNIRHVRKALIEFASFRYSNSQEPLEGDIMRAIARFDMNFQLMHDMLTLQIHWTIQDVVVALKLLVQSFETANDHSEQLALCARTANGDEQDIAMTNGDSDQYIVSESRAAENELDHAMSTLFSGLQVRSAALRIALTRLHAFPQIEVTAAMRTLMTRRELIFFINILRVELEDGGWTKRYAKVGDDQYEDNIPNAFAEIDGDGPSNQAIRAIGDMLNCAVDAIGTSGWLIGLSADQLSTEELVHQLRAEISASVEGCYEADALHTILSELDKYASSVQAPQTTSIMETEDAALPVSCRAEMPSTKGKKTKAHMRAREKSMRVGKYSIDRIRL
ncbi:Hypothetical protein R9X50_00483800 [Acrodontium crateriforme]|uniref:Uncharacterized protein n=1 Tax=Acrodontium crateriforme TaxID=150365 RepID=A0AAQ3M5B0_9PEZI|nr:Hypothetical protein R9X50_00483800 [Acrodontium crateriforme]